MEVPDKPDIDALIPRISSSPTVQELKKVIYDVHKSADKLRSNQIVIASEIKEECKKLIRLLGAYLAKLSAIRCEMQKEKDEIRRVSQRTVAASKDIQKAFNEFVEQDNAMRVFSKSFNEAVKRVLAIFKKEGVVLKKVSETPESFKVMSADGESFYRVEFDDNFKAHLNVNIRGRKMVEHFQFPGNKKAVQSIIRQLRTTPTK